MISFFETTMSPISIHHIGNKSMDEHYYLSYKPQSIETPHSDYLLKYFLSPFEKVNDEYEFFHPSSDLQLNTIYNIYNGVTGLYSFHEASKKIATHLFDVSSHPKIKSGELFVVHFKDVQYKGELLSAIGIFKSENKETYLKFSPNKEGFDVGYEDNGVDINQLDKGCLILTPSLFSLNPVVLCIDNNKDNSYWKDEFLGLKVVNNDYNKTITALNLCKSFISEKLDDEYEISSTDKAELLNKTITYFKDKESFDMEEYASDVFNNTEVTSSFKKHVSIYGEEFDENLPDCFDISGAAVKKSKSAFKAILKLDKNFHIYVHGNKDLIERGFDDDKGLNFYKIYYKEEQ